jgi:molybdopterin-guanine dinucleotide biosynthesis protein A
MMPMFDVQGFILVGGESSRMGKDKAQLMFGEQTSVELIAAALHNVTELITTVGGPPQNFEALPNIPDLQTGWGPLAGIETALHHAKFKHCLIVACDFPFVTATLFERLLTFIGDSDAVVPLQSDDRPQPLCAVYRTETCLPAAKAAIAADAHSPRNLLDRLRTRYVPFSMLSDLEASSYFFFNMNTPENYERARRIFAERTAQKSETGGSSSGRLLNWFCFVGLNQIIKIRYF